MSVREKNTRINSIASLATVFVNRWGLLILFLAVSIRAEIQMVRRASGALNLSKKNQKFVAC